MLKISDILKKARRQEKSADKSVAGNAERVSPPAPAENPSIPDMPVVNAAPQQPSAPVAAAPGKTPWQVVPDRAIRDTYEQAIALARQVMDPAAESAVLLPAIKQNIDALIASLQRDEDQLMRLFFGDYFTEQGYLYQHSVNVAVLCASLGNALHYSQARIRQLTLAAFLHDIGLAYYMDIISQPRRLSTSEYNDIKKHPVTAKERLKCYGPDLDVGILEVVAQEHERVDGSGYPYNLPGPEINNHAKLVGLADVYEALLHQRPYREKMSCLETVKQLLAMKQVFEYSFIKTLLDVTGVFPVTTAVKLSTREIGVVIHQNSRMPLRPVVEITHNTQGQTLSERKYIDLGGNFSVYIQDCFEESALKR
ncbi:MAG: HD domain-containing protein [Candidatus Omnitrophica bacterium]|nr:HD domain-containing protein [Candidatus Omnitrophota bacterium]